MKNRVYQQIVTAAEAVPDLVQDQVVAAEAVRVQTVVAVQDPEVVAVVAQEVVAVVAQEVVLGLEAAAGAAADVDAEMTMNLIRKPAGRM